MWQFVAMGMTLGSALGLSGAGGAIVGIPFLMTLTGLGLKQATVLILPIVGISAFLTWIPQHQDTKWPLLGLLFVPTLATAHVCASLKPWLPEWSVAALLIFIALLGLIQTWTPKSKPSTAIIACSFPRLIAMGIVSGALSTLTGLGGGLLLVPLLEFGCHLHLKEAVSTSLALIVVNSVIASAMLALHGQTQWLPPLPFLEIVCGSILTALLLKKGLTQLPTSSKTWIQKSVYTLLMSATVLHLLTHL